MENRFILTESDISGMVSDAIGYILRPRCTYFVYVEVNGEEVIKKSFKKEKDAMEFGRRIADEYEKKGVDTNDRDSFNMGIYCRFKEWRSGEIVTDDLYDWYEGEWFD